MHMGPEELLAQCHAATAGLGGTPQTADDLIGLFQTFRPHGDGLESIFAGLRHGDELHARLQPVFDAAGDPRRPTGGMDVYFIVRKPRPIDEGQVELAARRWLSGLAALAESRGQTALRGWLEGGLQVRVLEGKPPKHPKDQEQRSALLLELDRISNELTASLQPSCDATGLLRQAYYFIACDPHLRDYLMWPIYREAGGAEDPLQDYFDLWRHGIKFRTFNNEQIDFYIPRVEASPLALTR